MPAINKILFSTDLSRARDNQAVGSHSDTRSATRPNAGGLVDPRDLKSEPGEPLPLPKEPVSEPVDNEDLPEDAWPTVQGMVDPRLTRPDATGTATKGD